MEDQESQATGYSYSSGSPTYLSNKDIQLPNTYDYFQPYEYHYLPVVDTSMHYVPKLQDDPHFKVYGSASPYTAIQLSKQKYGYGKPHDYVASEGKKHENEVHASHGQKDDKGFKNAHTWDKANKGVQGKENNKGWYNVAGGKKTVHHDEGDHYKTKEEEGKSEKGGSFKEAKGHNKGAKTNGFHKVYLKDEYKKDHEFYDDADRKGYYNKYGDFNTNYSKDKGAYEKGGHSQYGYRGADQGKDGFYDKGQYEDEDKGHKAARGGSNFHKNYEEFVQRSQAEGGKKYEYDDGNGASKWKF